MTEHKDHPEYCVKEAEIAVLQVEHQHTKETLKRIEKNIDIILKKLNNGITTTMETLADTVNKQEKKIKTLENLDFVPREESKTRKSDMKNMSPWKKAGIIMSGITLFLAFAYTIGSLLIFVGNILQGLPK